MGIEFTICETGEVKSYTWLGFREISSYIINYFNIKGFMMPPCLAKLVYADNNTDFIVQEIKDIDYELNLMRCPITFEDKWKSLLEFIKNAVSSESMIITS